MSTTPPTNNPSTKSGSKPRSSGGSRPSSAADHRRTDSASSQRKGSISGGKSGGKVEGPGSSNPGNGGGGRGHGRKPSARGGGRGGKQSPAPHSAAGTGDMVSNLKNLIASMPPGSSSDGDASSPQTSGSTLPQNHNRRPSSGGHRKAQSAHEVAAQSNLNPTASGFQPGALSVIADTHLEEMITPTASSFDLMTGARLPPQGQSGPYRQMPAGAFNPTMMGNRMMMELPEEIPGFGGVAGLNARAFSFGGPGANDRPPRFQNQGGLDEQALNEQMVIQQQLAVLQRQQEELMMRLEGQNQQQQQPSQGPPSAGGRGGHRRIQSHAPQSFGGAGGMGMGNYGLGQPFVGGFGQSQPSSQTGTFPKGHGRRHSVNVATSKREEPADFVGGFGNLNLNEGGTGGGGAVVGGQSQGQSQGHGRGHSHSHSRNQSFGTGYNPQGFQPGGMMNSTDLAAAQNQLAQLSHFRASSGHARIPSFGFNNPMNMPPNTNPMQYNAGGQPMRKSLFAPYLPQASIPPLLAAGKLVVGTLRVNKRNRSDAYVSTDSLDADIYICGSKDRNRALEGDIVAVELLDVDEVWGTKKEKEEKKRKKEENSFDTRANQDLRKADKKKDDVEVEGQGLTLFEDEEVNDDQRPQFAGHIVAVVERMPGQLFSGTLGVLRPSSAATKEKQEAERREREGVDLQGSAPQADQKPRIVWFKPTDKRVPLIAIPTEQAPADFVENSNNYKDQLFVACIKRWPITSLHPFGTLVEQLGTIGDIDTETNALLKDASFSADEFTDNVLKCLPPLPYDIPAREFEVRKDFRLNRVFTIDPVSAKDLDDALHIIKGEDGLWEVGIHIADVSHFVKPNTALDREARKRATTVYLVQKAVPMMPEGLSNGLCSLTPGADKLTFSVVVKMTDEAKVVSTWFGKSVIRSAGQLAYEQAQAVLDGQPLDVVLEGDHKATDLAEDIKALNTLAKEMRKRRFDNGALSIDRVKIGFKLGEDGLPEDCVIEERKESKNLIEEFMLLANTSVAAKIASALPEQAMLRRHESPIDRRLEAFVERAKRMGYDFDPSSAGSLQNSFNRISDLNHRLVLQTLSIKSMLRAKYFCSGMLDIAKYSHYALNVPLYTHFTSPIRRYADVLVHRQLEAAILGAADVKFNLDTEAVSKIAQGCNSKRDSAKFAQEQSIHLFLCQLVSELTLRYGPVIRSAVVTGVLDEAFDVVVPEFGIEKRVHVDQMPIENHVFDEHEHHLTIYWKPGVDPLKWLAETSNDSHLLSIRRRAEHHAKLMEAQSASAAAEADLFEDDEDEEEEGEVRKLKAAPKNSAQHVKSASASRASLRFEGVEKTANGHHIQKIQELQIVPVIIAADLSKSPPVLKILAVNPFN